MAALVRWYLSVHCTYVLVYDSREAAAAGKEDGQVAYYLDGPTLTRSKELGGGRLKQWEVPLGK